MKTEKEYTDELEYNLQYQLADPANAELIKYIRAEERVLHKAQYHELDQRFEHAVQTLSKMDSDLKAAVAEERGRCLKLARTIRDARDPSLDASYIALAIERGDVPIE